MQQYQFIKITATDYIATLTLNRPDKRNAMHADLIKEVLVALKQLASDDTRVLLIQGAGDNFCAGGDIHWMQQIAASGEEDNLADAQLLADMLNALYMFPKPTIVLAHGAVMGGGLGLLAACDIAFASDDAFFSFSEVKIGLTPSMISPYAIAAIGERAAHYYFLTGDKFEAQQAQQLGLVMKVTTRDTLQAQGMQLAETLLKNSPQALRKTKQLIRLVAKEKITPILTRITAKHLADLRQTPEAQEGLKAFMEKRKPRWSCQSPTK